MEMCFLIAEVAKLNLCRCLCLRDGLGCNYVSQNKNNGFSPSKCKYLTSGKSKMATHRPTKPFYSETFN
jgi:hypothetical protein